MTGASEILVLVLLILAVLILPRLLKPAGALKKDKNNTIIPRLPPLMRTGIFLSVAFPVFMILKIKPWDTESGWVDFLAYGILPVALSWGLFWIISGFRK